MRQKLPYAWIMDGMLGAFVENAMWVQFGGLGIYLIWGFSLFAIARQVGEEYAWFAFIPILNLLLMAKLARISPLWWLLVFTCVGAFVYVYYWFKIGQRKGPMGGIMGILTIVPCVNLFAPVVIAMLPVDPSA